MKRLWLGAVALVELIASGSIARAVPFDFTYTGTLVTFTVPESGLYQILAFGAQGGRARFGDQAGPGGRGAEIGGAFSLTAGETLEIAVGGAASNGGGGGGSFVVAPGNKPLVIAGGGGAGGGFGVSTITPLPGQGGLIGQNGGSPGGGTAGSGGNGFFGGGGGGFLSAGSNGFLVGVTGGAAFPDLAGGTPGGGFGGGGGGDFGAGGGGGYSGGGGGSASAGGSAPGGGGGSFDAGTDQILVADFRTGNGEVVITELAAAVPEPASIVLLGAGVAGLAAIGRRRRRHLPVLRR